MKNKIISIVCIFLLIISCFLTTVKADSTKTLSYGGVNYILPSDVPDNYLIIDATPYNERRLYFTDTTYSDFCVVFQKDADTVLKILDNNNFNQFISVKWYSIGLNETDFTKGTFHSDIWSSLGTQFNPDVGFVYSTNDIYRTTNNYKPGNGDKPFFQVSPLTKILVTEKTEKKTIQEILGLLPLTLVVVVSFLGLRKALQMLLSFLRRS